MPTIETIYTGDLRTQALHLQSGKIVITDAPTDNQGKGEAFSPTTSSLPHLEAACLPLWALLPAHTDSTSMEPVPK